MKDLRSVKVQVEKKDMAVKFDGSEELLLEVSDAVAIRERWLLCDEADKVGLSSPMYTWPWKIK